MDYAFNAYHDSISDHSILKMEMIIFKCVDHPDWYLLYGMNNLLAPSCLDLTDPFGDETQAVPLCTSSNIIWWQ